MIWVGSVPLVGKNIRCKKFVWGAEVTFVEAMGVYENGIYMSASETLRFLNG